MDTKIGIPSLENTIDLKAWHKPEVRRLEVSLDTRDSGGSSGDGAFGTPPDDGA